MNNLTCFLYFIPLHNYIKGYIHKFKMDKPRGILSILKPTETFPSMLSPFFNEETFKTI